jgi:hypothetical protein
MKYKNLVIKCKNVEELIKLQKHLFEYKYAWFDYSRNRSFKKFKNISYVVIQNDDILKVFAYDPVFVGSYAMIDYISFEKKFERKLKLKKINNV